jgi:AcrR family transcriptional regulator
MPRLVDHDARKRELLDASLALVAAEGIEAATLRRLARAADCTTGAITYYFEGRDALLVAMLRRAHQTTGARMLRAAGRGASPRDRLWAVLMEALPLDPERLAVEDDPPYAMLGLREADGSFTPKLAVDDRAAREHVDSAHGVRERVG